MTFQSYYIERIFTVAFVYKDAIADHNLLVKVKPSLILNHAISSYSIGHNESTAHNIPNTKLNFLIEGSNEKR